MAFLGDKGKMDGALVVIEGTIGAGKTTLVQNLEELLSENVITLKECISENLMAIYYSNMQKWGMISQNMCMQESLARSEKADVLRKGGQQVLVDCGFLRTGAFAGALHEQGIMSDSEYALHMDMHAHLMDKINPPDLVIYLDVSPDVALGRIKSRSRDSETTVTKQYLQMLEKHYRRVLQKAADERGWRVIYVSYDVYIHPRDFLKIIEKKKK